MLRRASASDLAWIEAQQSRPELAQVIYRDGARALAAYLADPGMKVLIWEEAGSAEGFAVLRGLDRRDRVVELLRLVVARPGRGIGGRFLAALCSHIFLECGAHRLWLDHFEGNDAAAQAYARAGFRPEGILREHALRTTGERASLVLLGLLRSDWEAGRADPPSQA